MSPATAVNECRPFTHSLSILSSSSSFDHGHQKIRGPTEWPIHILAMTTPQKSRFIHSKPNGSAYSLNQWDQTQWKFTYFLPFRKQPSLSMDPEPLRTNETSIFCCCLWKYLLCPLGILYYSRIVTTIYSRSLQIRRQASETELGPSCQAN